MFANVADALFQCVVTTLLTNPTAWINAGDRHVGEGRMKSGGNVETHTRCTHSLYASVCGCYTHCDVT